MSDKLKSTLGKIGTLVGNQVGNAYSAAMDSVATTDYFMRKQYSTEDQLFAGFAHDVKQARKAFKFLSAQNSRLATKHWPRMLAATASCLNELIAVLGPDLLQFPDMAQLHNALALLQAQLERVYVHPKERQTSIESIDSQLASAAGLVVHLQQTVLPMCAGFSQKTAARLATLDTHLKHLQTRLAARKELMKKCVKLKRRHAKLKKKAMLQDGSKYTADADACELRHAHMTARLDALSSKLRLAIPELWLMVEEFTESFLHWCLCQHHAILEQLTDAYKFLAQFHGLSDEDLELQWESAVTPIRLRVELLLLSIYSKKPQLVATDIAEGDSTLKTKKVWAKVRDKATQKTHKVKALEKLLGLFAETADPLASFETYNVPSRNLLDVYHPKYLVHKAAVPEKQPALLAPPLPPRSAVPLSIPSPAIPSEAFSSWQPDSPEYALKPDTTLDNDNDSVASEATLLVSTMAHLMSEVLLLSSGLSVSLPLEPGATEDTLQAESGLRDALHELYNSRKNEIVRAPEPAKPVVYEPRKTAFDVPASSATLKLMELAKFFTELEVYGKTKVAARAFEGSQPGDLSVEPNDEVEVLLDLQENVITFNPEGPNWLVCAVGDRVGWVPSTCFEKP